MTEVTRIENIKTRNNSKTGLLNISETIRQARLRWLGHIERRTDENVVMRSWKMELTVIKKGRNWGEDYVVKKTRKRHECR